MLPLIGLPLVLLRRRKHKTSLNLILWNSKRILDVVILFNVQEIDLTREWTGTPWDLSKMPIKKLEIVVDQKSVTTTVPQHVPERLIVKLATISVQGSEEIKHMINIKLLKQERSTTTATHQIPKMVAITSQTFFIKRK